MSEKKLISKKEQLDAERLYSTDGIAKEIWQSLLSDFRFAEGSNFCCQAEKALETGVPEFRNYSFAKLGIVSPLRFKRRKQLESLFKKYRFKNDLYTDEELNARTFSTFISEQVSFSSLRPERKPIVHMVLQCARKHARRILGRYDPELTPFLARFGKKSSIGCPLVSAYIDYKLTNVRAFTSSTDCISWFRDGIVNNDAIIMELLCSMGLKPDCSDLQMHDTLKLVFAPKSWKTHRPITPLTLITLFYSYGVGRQVETCLKGERLNLSTLQQRHARLVRDVSETRRLATADLSSASQSLLSDLLNSVLPRDWYNAIRKTFVHQMHYEGTSFYVESVLPMGNGLTFPVETLVFYVILKAIAELSKVKGLISVYGDDLIYPSRLHDYVAVIFPLLKFKLNLDKTFVKAPFRESCGTDFYRGVDVRPMFLPAAGHSVSKMLYTVFLHKTLNGLLRRWSEVQISGTISLLLREIDQVNGVVYRIPPGYPDTAGVKVESEGATYLCSREINWSPVKVLFHNGSKWFHFQFIQERPKKRDVCNVLPYYWLALQGLDDDVTDKNFWETDYSYLRTLPTTNLFYKKRWKDRAYITSSGKTYRKRFNETLVQCTSRKDASYSVTKTSRESISYWF